MLNDRNASPDRLMELSRQFVTEGFLSDAVDFAQKAVDEQGLNDLVELAIEDGDYFLLVRIGKALGRELTDEERGRVAERAEVLGKSTFADQARAARNEE